MNRDSPEPTDTPCNVCENGHVEVGSAWSRCSNRNCPTRDNDNTLSTDSTPEEIADYWKTQAIQRRAQSALSVEEAKERAIEEFKTYFLSTDKATAEEAEIRCEVFLDLAGKGWGWVKEEADV